jgi:ABC-type uncharacterized transport system YnjBCD permease subunit
MTRTALYIRLFFATVAAIASAVFVWVYTPTSMGIVRARLGKEFRGFPSATQAVADLRWHPVLLPVILLVFGIFVIHRWKSSAVFELVVGSLWLFAFLWLAYCLLLCILPEIPMITPLHGPP